jgi:phage terminase large subunit
MPFHNRTDRWSCLVAHRRAGKTVAAINDLIKRGITEGNRSAQYAYIAPFRSQAKRVAWDYLKYYAAPITKTTNESDLMVELLNGAKIMLFGSDNADAMRGLGFNGVYLDEYGDFKPSVWGNVIRPTLSDRLGWAVFGGTPKGKNQFHDIYKVSQATPNWFLLRLPATVSKILPESELEAARAQLSQDQYDQEYECSFDAAILGAFYGQEMRQAQDAGRICELPFEPESPVYTAWDLGYRDDTAIWWYQVVRGEIRVMDYYAVSGASIEQLADVVNAKGYRYTKHYLPHDARAKTLASGGKSIIEQLAAHLGA